MNWRFEPHCLQNVRVTPGEDRYDATSAAPPTQRSRCVRLGHRLRRRRHAPFGTWRCGNDSCDRRDHESRNERGRKGNYLGASVPPWMTANVRVLPPLAQRSEPKASVNNALLGCTSSSTPFSPPCHRAATAFAQLSLDARGNCATGASLRVRNMPLQPLFERRPRRHRMGAVPLGIHRVGAPNSMCNLTFAITRTARRA